MPKSRAGRILLLLAAEKVVQHIVVTVAFAVDAFDIRDTVAIDYRWLLWTGLLLASLFAFAVIGLIRHRRWSLPLMGALAVADIVGEFIAQGQFWITINVSFIVAVGILALVARAWRHPAGA